MQSGTAAKSTGGLQRGTAVELHESAQLKMDSSPPFEKKKELYWVQLNVLKMKYCIFPLKRKKRGEKNSSFDELDNGMHKATVGVAAPG